MTGSMDHSPLQLRRARAEDCETIWRWRNAPDVRRLSFDSKPIPLDAHAHWFSSKLETSDCVMYMAQGLDGKAVGFMRFDIRDGQAVASVILAPNRRGSGLGSQLIATACQELLAAGDTNSVTACIKVENEPSRRAFSRAGFVEIDMAARKESHSLTMRYVGEKCQ